MGESHTSLQSMVIKAFSTTPACASLKMFYPTLFKTGDVAQAFLAARIAVERDLQALKYGPDPPYGRTR